MFVEPVWRQLMTPQLEREIVRLYVEEELSAGAILKEIKTFKTTKTIYDTLRKHGIKAGDRTNCQDPSLDHFYFTEINTPDKAYLLGLIITDGWVSKAKTRTSPQIAFSLKQDDQYLVEWVRDQWKSRNKINIIKKDTGYMLPQGKVSQKACVMSRIMVSSGRMFDDLDLLGVTPGKSYMSLLPLLEDDSLYGHLIRGLIDGDGTIGVYDHGGAKHYLTIRLTGTQGLLSQVSFLMADLLGVTYLKPSLKDKDKGVFSSLHYMKARDVSEIVNFMYPRGEDYMYLKRKREVIEDFLGKTDWEETNLQLKDEVAVS